MFTKEMALRVFLEYNDKVFTCSVHCEKNFPARKAQSDLDINIPRDTQTDEYLQIMADGFEKADSL